MMAAPHFRAQARRKVELQVLLRQQRKAWERDARIVDLGLGGACLELGEPLAAGTEVLIEIRTPTLWDPLLLPGSVAWSRRLFIEAPFRLGIRFLHHSPAALLALFDLLGAHGFDL
jgi:hypothetical protein